MTDKDLLDEIAGEAVEGFAGEGRFGERKEFTPPLPRYRVNNRNPFNPASNEGFVPGIKMTVVTGTKDARVKQEDTVERVQAVILYSSHGRKLETGSGASFRTVCQSHDGSVPSVRVDAPLCRQATSNDLVRILSKWKGYDAAKIDAKIKEITDGEGKLTVCGLKSASGGIPLCPFATKNPVTGKKGDCTPHFYVQAYDIKLKRQFQMELTGKAMWESKTFVAPIHQFFQFLRSQGKDKVGLPCYAFVVDLTAVSDDKYYYLGVSNWRPISDVNNRNEMKQLAMLAKSNYEKQATRLSKEAYEKARAQQQAESAANRTDGGVSTVPSSPPPVVRSPSSGANSPSAAGHGMPAKVADIWDDEDDINF